MLRWARRAKAAVLGIGLTFGCTLAEPLDELEGKDAPAGSAGYVSDANGSAGGGPSDASAGSGGGTGGSGGVPSCDGGSECNRGKTPDQFAGLTAWLKADAIVGLSDGETVQTWTDSSGAGHDFAQPGAAEWRPIYLTNQLNGLPVVHFDGTDDWLENSVDNLLSASQKTVFIVFRATALTLNDPLEVWNNHGLLAESNKNWGVFLSTDSLYQYNWDDNADLASVSYTAGDWRRAQARHESGFIYTNKDNDNPTPAASGDTASINVMWLGAGSVGFLSGDIAEVILFDAVVSQTDRASIDAYLTLKYFSAAPP